MPEITHRECRPHVAFEIGLQVGIEPESCGGRTSQDFGITAAQEGHLGGFASRKGQQLKDGGAPGHGFGDPLHQGCLLRAGQKPLTSFVWLAVHPRTHQRKDLGHVLHFVEDHGRLHLIEKAVGVLSKSRDHVRVLQQEVGCPRHSPSQERGLAGAARTGEDDRREAARRPEELVFEFARDEAHLSFLKCQFRKLKPRNSRLSSDLPSRPRWLCRRRGCRAR